jgi:predicted RNA-binding Zn ribbon-like protein
VLKDPGDRAPAPGPLRLVQAFVNTVDTENGVEELDRPEALRALLSRLDLPGGDGPVGDDDLERALAVREALRALLLGNNGVVVPADAYRTLEQAGRDGRLAVRFAADGTAVLAAEAAGPDGALGGLVGVAYTAMAEGSWRRLKACRREICHWIYYDRSRNGSSTWCAMSVCGNRTKTRAYRVRRASG